MATATLSHAEIAAPIRQIKAKQRNIIVLLAEVTGIDVASRTIEATSPGAGVRKIAFDYLAVATGMRPSYFGYDEFAQYAPGLKSLGDAETIRAKSAFELAATTEDEDQRARQMTFVLVGAGPSGVELAASLVHLVRSRCGATSIASIRQRPALFCSTQAAGFCQPLLSRCPAG